MRILELHQIHDVYDHVYLSPHLDDAVFSCGGAIARHTAAGTRALVITICTAAPAVNGPFSALAQEFHEQWGLSPAEVVDARLREDVVAMERIGADSYWAGMSDAIYRLPNAYHSRETLFALPAPNDPLLETLRQFIAEVRSRTPRAVLYAPLGVGHHIDHLITYAAVLASADTTVAFYEDFPYVTRPGAIEARLAEIGRPLIPSTIPIDGTLMRKIGAIAAYASQLQELFGGPEAMERLVARYAEELIPEVGTYGERVWLWDAQA